MNRYRSSLLIGPVLIAALGTIGKLSVTPAVHAQQATTQSADAANAQGSTPVIKAETRLVLVDTVVTDKHGNYIRDLTQKDFKIFEDNKEQPIKSFSYEADPASPTTGQKHYMVLFFDNSTMEFGDQAQARSAAAKFIDANVGPNRYMAIINYGGTVHVAQNFSSDAARLKQVVSGIKISVVNPNTTAPVEVAAVGGNLPVLYGAEADYGARTLLLALRAVAKNLASVPGRKSLVLLTAGFAWNSEVQSELTALISVCNKANIAVYPIDVRGLLSPATAAPTPQGAILQMPSSLQGGGLLNPDLDLMVKRSAPVASPHLEYVAFPAGDGQKGGGGGGGGHGGGGHAGGSTGSTGSTGGHGGAGYSTPMPVSTLNPFNQPRQIVPPFPPSATTNQQVLYELAEGTGGFVIVNTNDLLGGLQKVAQEQVEYYTLGYTPPDSDEGSCHTLKVKVDRGGTIVRARSGYCNTKPVDFLAGKPAAKELETRAAASQAGNVDATMLAPYFFTSANVARVDLALEMPPSAIKFEKANGKQHATINILGIAYKPDGSVAARFSDSVELNFDNKDQLKDFQKKPFHYENQFEVAPGQYTLKVVFSSGGESFGKVEEPLSIDPYDGKQFALSAVALSHEVHKYGSEDTTLDSELLEDHKPLLTQGMEVVPAASNRFKKSDTAAIYVEAYEPLLKEANPPKVGLEIIIVDRKTGEKKIDAGVSDTSGSVKAGNPVVPLGLKLPIDRLPPGTYQVQLVAIDSAGNHTKPSSANFDLVE